MVRNQVGIEAFDPIATKSDLKLNTFQCYTLPQANGELRLINWLANAIIQLHRIIDYRISLEPLPIIVLSNNYQSLISAGRN